MEKGLIRSSFIHKKKSTIHKKVNDLVGSVNKDNFIRIKDLDIISSIGDIPDSKAFFICGAKDRKELFIYGGSDVNRDTVSHEVYFLDLKENFFTCLSNISQIKLCLGISSDLSGHTFEMLNFSGEIKLFIFGGFNGREYTNKCFLIDTGIS